MENQGSERGRRIFYSWQSDTAPRENRNLIQEAIERAAKSLAAQLHASDRPEVQTSSSNVIGARSISEVIFERIRSADVFVADVSLVVSPRFQPTTGAALLRTLLDVPRSSSRKPERASPNPNVLVETGYALNALGEGRMVLVANTAFGRIEDLPFDLRGRLSFTYEVRAGGELGEPRKKLARGFEQILGPMLTLPRTGLDVRIDVGVYALVPADLGTGVSGGQTRMLGITVRNFSDFALRLTWLGFEEAGGDRGFAPSNIASQLAQPIPPRDSRVFTMPPEIVEGRDDLPKIRVVAKDSLARVWYADPGALLDALAANAKGAREATP
jgi:hypothetical protein